MSTTPTAGMERLLGLPPLHLAVKEEATKQVARLYKYYNYLRGNLKGHMMVLKEFKPIAEMLGSTDIIPRTLNFNMKHNTIITSRQEWASDPNWLRNDAQKWFTDGSKTDHGVGAGIAGPRCNIYEPLSRDSTVFQAELYALTTAVHTLK